MNNLLNCLSNNSLFNNNLFNNLLLKIVIGILVLLFSFTTYAVSVGGATVVSSDISAAGPVYDFADTAATKTLTINSGFTVTADINTDAIDAAAGDTNVMALEIINNGTITTSGTGRAIDLSDIKIGSIPTITNNATGIITGDVLLDAALTGKATVTNAGTITGTTTLGINAANVITNSGSGTMAL